VKDSKDSKLSDPFYDSLEGLLSDLKAVTVVCGAALSLSPLKVDFGCRIIGMQKLFLNRYPKRKYRTTTRVNSPFCYFRTLPVVLKLRHSYCNPNGFSDNVEEGQAEKLQVETRIQR
jgi:hypothetical protein